MATMTIRIPDSKHERLRLLAENQGVSLNKLVEEWASTALAQFDAEARFRARAARGSVKRGLALLDKVDDAFKTGKNAGKRQKRKDGKRVRSAPVRKPGDPRISLPSNAS